MKNILFTLIFINCCLFAQSQNEQSNSSDLIFKKAYVESTPEGGVLTDYKPSGIDGYRAFYFDGKKKIRKVFEFFSYPESAFYVMANYNTDGQLQSIEFNISQPEGFSINGHVYRKGNKSNSIFYNYEIQSMEDLHAKRVSKWVEGFPSTIGDWNLSQYHDIDRLLNFLQIKSVRIPKKCKGVTFDRPKEGDVAFVNTNNVNIRSELGEAGEIIKILSVGEALSIEEELDQCSGANCWYRVKFADYYMSGYNIGDLYIFGAFLNNTEREVE